MAAPAVATTVATTEFHTCVTGLLQYWKSSDSTPVEFSVPALRYSSPSPSEDTVLRVMSGINGDPGSEHEFSIQLKSGIINDWLRGEWIAEIEMGTITNSGYNSFKSVTWETDEKHQYIGDYYGKKSWVTKFLLDAAIPDELHIRIRLRRTTPLTKGPQSLTHELTQLRTSVIRLDPTLSFLDRPSIEMTRICFSSRDGPLKYLYVPSQVLLKYAYFRACHASGFSETEAHPAELSELAKRKTSPANEDSASKEGSELYGGTDSNVDADLDQRKGVYEDVDSDAEWELEEQKEYEHSVDLKFKATIHVKDISRRTYKAFIDWALCGALHFAPCRAAYVGYVESCTTSGVEEVLEWPVWAESHRTTINDFGNFKTLSSPKSLYRFADKLLILDLKALCRQQIINDFKATTLIQEIAKIRNHPELLKDAYEYVRDNWDLVVQQKNFIRILSNCPDSSLEVFYETVLTKLSINK